MADTVSIGHQIAYSIQQNDTNGNVMLVPIVFDSPPVMTNAPSAPGVDTFTVSADGTTAVLVAEAAGSDTVTLAVVFQGASFGASDFVTISPAPQVFGGVELISVVT